MPAGRPAARFDGALALAFRLRPLPFALVFALLFLSLAWLCGGLQSSLSLSPPALVNPGGNPAGRDFVAFWSAASLALSGHPAAPYEPTLLRLAEQEAVGAPVGFFAWFYPPTFLLLVLPLAALPYLVALGLWLAAPFVAFARLLRQVAPHPLTAAAALIFPATAQCLISGQNGIFSAFLVTGGLIHVERRPLLAGIFFGTLGYKPQMIPAVVAALFFGRHWRALAALFGTLAVLAAASLAAFGPATWEAFLRHADDARAALETGQLPWERMATVFAAARLAGVGIGGAYLLQSFAVLGAIAALAHLWRRNTSLGSRGAALSIAMPLVTPFAYDYDLVVILLAIAWLLQEGFATGFRRGEIAVIVLAWACPVAGWLLAWWSHVSLTPLVLALFLAATLRRAAPAAAALVRPGSEPVPLSSSLPRLPGSN